MSDDKRLKGWYQGFPTVRSESEVVEKGGPGSGHWGHAGGTGGPGHPGGSVPRETAMSIATGRDWKERQAEIQEIRNKVPLMRRPFWKGEVVEVPESMGEKPTVHEMMTGYSVMASWKYPMSTKREDGISNIARGKDGKYYAFKKDNVFEVEPVEMSSSGKVPWYGTAGKKAGEGPKPKTHKSKALSDPRERMWYEQS